MCGGVHLSKTWKSWTFYKNELFESFQEQNQKNT